MKPLVAERDLDKYWKTVVSTIQDGIMIVDAKGCIVSTNRALETMTGYSREELVGQKCSVLNCSIFRLARERGRPHWCMLFKSGKFNVHRCTIVKKDGTCLGVLKNASLLQDGEGNVIGAVETLTDLTEILEKDRQIEAFRRELGSQDTFQGMIGVSAPMRRVFDHIENAARSEAPVIIFGESGTGKELVAKAIHQLGDRKDYPFVKVNCAALTETLLGSELFGHVRGAFTGAFKNRLGRFQIADSGDLFLDEIGDLPLSTQVKLLRVLEEKVIEQVGDNRQIPIDVRLIAATNRDLTELVEKGSFRKDLYFRINVIPINLPPLRERIEDIPLLAEAFFRKLRLKSGKRIEAVSIDAMEFLKSYNWPGNVRELKSAFEYAFVTCHQSTIQPQHLPPDILKAKDPAKVPVLNSREIKRRRLVDALNRAKGNQSLAAELLGVSRVTVWNQMKRFGIIYIQGPDDNDETDLPSDSNP